MKTKSIASRILSLFIATLLLLGALPISAADSEFISENVLRTDLESAVSVDMDVNGDVSDSTRFDAALEASTDGDTVKEVFMGTGLDWDPPHWFGIKYTLNNPAYISHITLHTGKDGGAEAWKVYASDSLEDLYSDANIAGTAEVTGGPAESAVVEVNRTIKYIAIFATYSPLYGVRVREFEAWTGEPSTVFVSENLFAGEHLTEKHEACFYGWNNGEAMTDGIYNEVPRFNDNHALDFSTDGDTSTRYDVYAFGGTNYPGARFHFDAAYFMKKIMIYSGTPEYKEVYMIYASDNYENLYDPSNKITEEAVCDGSGTEIVLNKSVQYISIFLRTDLGEEQFGNGMGRVAEFEAWTGDPEEIPEPGENSLKVLTIGNSFAENASTYATQIAKANGHELTFGYLKYPSCSIEQHLEAAEKNLAVFRFEVKYPNGSSDLVKPGKSGYDFTDDPSTCATIADAISFTKWDVIVFQQDSSNARYSHTFAKLGALKAKVLELCTANGYDAAPRLMFHEVWRWAYDDPNWGEASFFGDGGIKSNSEQAARDNDLELIPSGLAFEYARDALGSDTIVNEDDGYWQHANNYGQYVAGCCYVGALFNITISEETFADDAVINKEGFVKTLTAAANKAVDYYHSYGDLNDDNKVNSVDMTILRKHLIGIGEVDTTLADANNDGDVNIFDLIRVKKHIADSNVVLGR